MLKKSLTILAAFVCVASVSCQKTEQTTDTGKETGEVAVGFGAYLGRGVSTKAGYAGDLTTEKLQTAHFGVFGYYTNDEPYSPSAKPDFMYNQEVFYSGGSWDYAPVKYWPNNYGSAAESDAIDRLSFFAYAPYVSVNYSTGIVDGDDLTGITALSRNTASGDPIVKYAVSMNPAECVDLCWGVAAGNFTSSVDGNTNTVAAGNPFINLIKPKTGDRLNFEFKHALAALKVMIDTDVDVDEHAGGDLDGATHIYVRSITFEGFTTRGALNLNSSAGTAAWSDLAGSSIPDKTPVTVHDGRRDGREGVAGAVASNETPTGLNPQVVQAYPYADAQVTPGVTHTPVSLFGTSDNSSVLVIPNGQSMKIKIVYDVETADDHLAQTLSDGVTPGSSIENAVSKSITIDGGDLTLLPGKRYTINLHLGMTSVKVGAFVSDWEDGSSADYNLPDNVTSDATVVIDPITGLEIPVGSGSQGI